MTIRSGPFRLCTKEPLADAVFMTTTSPGKSPSQPARSASVKSGPCTLNFTLRPSKVPWPINTIQSSVSSTAAIASRNFSVDFSLSAPSPIRVKAALPFAAASRHFCADSWKTRSYSPSPPVPTTARIWSSFSAAETERAKRETSRTGRIRGMKIREFPVCDGESILPGTIAGQSERATVCAREDADEARLRGVRARREAPAGLRFQPGSEPFLP